MSGHDFEQGNDDLERRLRRYAPLAPPPHLRRRLFEHESPRRAWPWAAAAAAMLGAAVGLSSLAGSVIEPSDVDTEAAQRVIEIESLAAIVDDAENPRAVAEWMIEFRDAERALEGSSYVVATTGSER